MSAGPAEVAPPSGPFRSPVHFVLLLAGWIAYAAVVVSTWGLTYWDFGDGNYLYISSRMNEGLTLYRDILAPQPPLHLVLGALVQRVGAIFGDPLIAARAYLLLLRLGTSALVVLVAHATLRCRTSAVAAGLLSLAMPIGFWWGLCLQSENLGIPLLLLSMLGVLSLTPRGVLLGGVAGALAVHTNMTFLPYLVVNVVFLVFRRPALAVRFGGAAAVVLGIGAGVAQWLTDGHYWSNVVANQAGSFPRTDILSSSRPGFTFADYAIEKITSEGLKVIELQGTLIAAAAAGLGLHIAEARATRDDADAAARDRWLRSEYLAWSAIGMWLSICFVMKGGTVNYKFAIGEVAVAIFAADAFVRLARALWPGAQWRSLSIMNTQEALRAGFLLVAVAMTVIPPARNIRLTLAELQAELSGSGVEAMRDVILSYARPGDPILAPPFYAYVTRTHVAGELAENYLWHIMYMNETFDRDRYGKPDGLGVRKMEELAAMLERREVPIVLLDMNLTGRSVEIQRALQAHYQPIETREVRTRNTPLTLWVPKGVPIVHRRLLADEPGTP